MNEGMTWDNIPEKLLVDLGQLTKANSIEGPFKAVLVLHQPSRVLRLIIIQTNALQATRRTTSQSSTPRTRISRCVLCQCYP